MAYQKWFIVQLTDKAFWNMEMQNIKEWMTMPSPEKFRETLTEFAVRQSVIDEIYLGYDGLDGSGEYPQIKFTFT